MVRGRQFQWRIRWRNRVEVAWTCWGTVLVFFVVIFGSIAKLNQRAARRIQREIETLDNEP